MALEPHHNRFDSLFKIAILLLALAFFGLPHSIAAISINIINEPVSDTACNNDLGGEESEEPDSASNQSEKHYEAVVRAIEEEIRNRPQDLRAAVTALLPATAPSGKATAVDLYRSLLSGRYPSLTEAQRRELLLVWKDESLPLPMRMSARNRILEGTLAFSFAFTRRYARFSSADFFDLLQEAHLGLFAAIDRYNPHHPRGSFLGLAVFEMRVRIIRYFFRNFRTVRFDTTPDRKKIMFYLYKRRLMQAELTSGDIGSIASLLVVPAEDVQSVHSLMGTGLRLDWKQPSDLGGIDSHDVVSEGNYPFQSFFERLIASKEAYDTVKTYYESFLYEESVTDRESKVLQELVLPALFDAEDVEDLKTNVALSEEWNISRERVRQILESALKKFITYYGPFLDWPEYQGRPKVKRRRAPRAPKKP